MGTSSMYDGPKRSPLLPPDFNDGDGSQDNPSPDNNPQEKPQEERPGRDAEPGKNEPSDKPREDNAAQEQSTSSNLQYSSWRAAKTSMSRYVTGNGGPNGKRNAVTRYIKGHGGSNNAAKTARAAIMTTIRIGDFFGGVSRNGISQVLKDNKILTEGRKPKEILSDIVNLLAPTPDLNDDSVARKALVITMSIIYERFDDESKDISLLDSLEPDVSKMLITKYFETYIYERLIHDLGSKIEKRAENSEAAAKIEKELKEYIETKVSTTLKDKPLSIINSNTDKVEGLVEGLYQQCYKVLEDQL
ncbi:MAG: hypothetical protein WCO63_02845 [Bacteroidota bacterium]